MHTHHVPQQYWGPFILDNTSKGPIPGPGNLKIGWGSNLEAHCAWQHHHFTTRGCEKLNRVKRKPERKNKTVHMTVGYEDEGGGGLKWNKASGERELCLCQWGVSLQAEFPELGSFFFLPRCPTMFWEIWASTGSEHCSFLFPVQGDFPNPWNERLCWG